ncbi:MAG: flagellar biosynthetic protein FliR [Rhodospirillales bacterium]|nr:flagellar biosynthetic protein FliR [Rhodospirillales bacterium]MCW8861053.1 flagellar biosynthetic protein FliR [Rhodospirillales bacterium]MCW8953059.1 flagellar biosynthetic protein FliR [Rhodospirillales bacterium]MCW8970693.1 flagellar biosynthetic protein FliR [Rhodospirillales bacterium]MCW9003476.1 flagellar biosynthetic protein FliR [Rhodospirillales bacterium]
MLSEVLSLNIYAFLLVFTRIGAALMVLPGFGDSYVNTQARLMFALAVSFVVYPMVADSIPAIPASGIGLAVLIVGEALIGFFIGTVARIIMAALHVAGTVAAFISAMANALVFDPVSEAQGSLLAGMLGTIGLVLLFVTNLHHLMLSAAIDSYTLFIPGKYPATGDMSELITHTVSGSFQLGVQLAAPFIVVAFAFNVAMGLVARLNPMFPVFFLGLPLQQVIALLTFAICLSAMMMVFLRHFDEGVRAFIAP